jgi:hypothetical protein
MLRLKLEQGGNKRRLDGTCECCGGKQESIGGCDMEFGLGFIFGTAITMTLCYIWFFAFYILKDKDNGKDKSED